MTGHTSSLLPSLTRQLADHGLVLDRVAPRSYEHALLQLSGPADDDPLPGQWYADTGRAASVARQTERAAAQQGRPGLVRLVGGHVVVQQGGADRRLGALTGLLAHAGTTLVTHRPERRAVLRHSDDDSTPTFTKVVRPGRAGPIARTLTYLDTPDDPKDHHRLRLPRTVALDEARGAITMTALPGRPLHELWTLPGRAVTTTRAMLQTGRALAALHTRPTPSWADRHDHADELAVTRRWLDLAEGHGVLPLPRSALDDLLTEAAGLLADSNPHATLVPLHRDLHDKQVLVDSTGVGLIDLDLLVAGHAALDVANLLVHLELRARQGLTTPSEVAACRDAFLGSYGWVATGSTRSLAGYALATRLRLLAVYAFRPRSTAAAVALVTDPLLLETE